MRARDGILMVATGILLTLSVGGYVWWEQQSGKEDAFEQSSAAKKNTSQTVTGAQSTPQQQSSGLQVKGAGQSLNKQSANTTLPGPENFQQYDQYANSGGVLYVDSVVGGGEAVKAGDVAAVLYKGWLTDGTLFDQTTKNEAGQFEAFSFKVGAGTVIGGWDQGIDGMKLGGKRRLVIPPAFAYGEEDHRPIPPNAVLVFDIELVAINPPQSTE